MIKSVTVAVPAYNTAENITIILESLADQETSGILKLDLLVHDDHSADNTTAIVRSLNIPRLRLIRSDHRLGFAGSVRNIFSHSDSDYVVILNDDVIIKNRFTILNLIRPMLKNPRLTLTSGNHQPLPPCTFVEKALISSFRAYEFMNDRINNGDNIMTCDGKIMAMSREFIRRIRYPADLSLMGNVDGYLYLENKRLGLEYKYVRSAKVFFRSPSTVSDYIRLMTRNNSSTVILNKTFGRQAELAYNKPKLLFYRAMAAEFFKNPLGSLFVFILGGYTKFVANYFIHHIPKRWKSIKSSKKLDFRHSTK